MVFAYVPATGTAGMNAQLFFALLPEIRLQLQLPPQSVFSQL